MKTQWIIGGLIFFTVIGLSFYAGRKSVKVVTNITTDTVIVVKTDTIKQTFTKFIKGKKDTVFIDSSRQYQTYIEVIDTIVTFKSDSLDFVAEIIFDDSTKTFSNMFDFNLRAKKVIEEIFREVPIYYKPELYQEPLVIALMVIASFLFGVLL